MGTEEKADAKVYEVKDNKEKGRKCFIITPIGNSDSEIFRHINGVIQSVIRPVLKDCGFTDIRAAHEISDPGSINNQLVNRIINDDLVIANLTGKNPNVMYELCLRHAVAKPVIHICEEGTNLPFDIKGERTIFYTNDMYGAEELKTEITKALNTINYEKEYKDNPIYSAIQMNEILKASTNEKIDANMLIIQQMEKLTSEIATINAKHNLNTSFKKTYIKDRLELSIQVIDFTKEKINKFTSTLARLIHDCNIVIFQDLNEVQLSMEAPHDENEIKKIIYTVANDVGIGIDRIIEW